MHERQELLSRLVIMVGQGAWKGNRLGVDREGITFMDTKIFTVLLFSTFLVTLCLFICGTN
jgi:hypothetical protein